MALSRSTGCVITFSSAYKEHGFLSNFYPLKMNIDGRVYYHVEGFYQSHKHAARPDIFDDIANITSPYECKKASRLHEMNEEELNEWNLKTKFIIMKRALFIKFSMSKTMYDMLLSTGDAELIEFAPYDECWGDGRNNRGRNMLGKMLMEIRRSLRCDAVVENKTRSSFVGIVEDDE